MGFFSKIKERINAALAEFKMRRKIDRIDRSDVLLTHRIVSRRLPKIRQWRLVGRVLKPSEIYHLRLAGYLILLGLSLIGGRWLLGHAVLVPSSGGEYREGIVGEPKTINPILVGGNDVDNDLCRLMFSGLYKRDADAKLVLDLAEKVDISSDGKTYTFTLKPGATFHDGQPVTADDVVYTLSAILDPSWKSPLAKYMGGMTAASLNARTVAVSTEKPSSYLPSLLTFGILPKHLWAAVAANARLSSDLNLKPIGSGPFKFEKLSRDSSGSILSYTMQSVRGSGSMLDRITFKFFDDRDTAADKLTGNSVDGLNFTPPEKAESIQSIPGTVIHAPALAQYTALFLNQKHNPALADQNVRAALAFAINRDALVTDALGGLGKVRDMPIPETAAGSTNAITRYKFDPAQAAALLDKAGYLINTTTKIRTKTQTTAAKSKKEQPVTTLSELAISITTIDTATNRRAAEMIKKNWEDLGVKTEIITAAPENIQRSVVRPREYDALLFGEVLGPDTDPFPYWHSSQAADGLNLSGYSNRRVDELLEKAETAVSTSARAPFLEEFQKIVTAELPAIFLYQPDYLYPQSSKIKNFNVRLMTNPSDRFTNVTNWYRKLWVAFK